MNNDDDDGPDAPNPNATTGKILLIVGLAALVGLIIFFLGTTIFTQRSPQLQAPTATSTVTIIYLGLYGTTGLLLIRNIFRVVEFSQGWCAPIPLALVAVWLPCSCWGILSYTFRTGLMRKLVLKFMWAQVHVACHWP